MKRTVPEGPKLSFSQKCSRLRKRLNEPEWRRHFALIIGGKALGLLVFMALILALNMLPAMLDAVRAEATLGEICDALRSEWGGYTEPARF